MTTPKTPSEKRKFAFLLNSNIKKVPTEFDNGDDLTGEVKQALIEHTAGDTRLNQYPFSPMAITEPTNKRSDGLVAPLSTTPNEQANSFNEYTSLEQQEFNSLSTSGMFDDTEKFEVRRGQEAQRTNVPTGTDILTDVSKNTADSNFSKKVRRTLGSNNLSSPDRAFLAANSNDNIVNKQDLENNLPVGVMGLNQLGVSPFTKNLVNNTVQYKEEQNLVTIKDLKKLGFSILLNASGEAFEPNYKADNIEENLQEYEAKSIAPAQARVGLKVPLSRFSPSKILEKIKPGYTKKNNLDTEFFDGESGVMSYGNTHNPVVQANSNSKTQIAVLSGMILALSTVITATTFAGIQLFGSNPNTNIRNYSGTQEEKKKFLGSALGKNNTDTSPAEKILKNSLGFDFIQTNHDFKLCVQKGLQMFFSLQGQGAGNAFLNFETKIFDSIEFYNSIMLNLTRDIQELSDFVTNTQTPLISKPSINNIAGLLNGIKSLNVTRFIAVLANLGDVGLTIEERGGSVAGGIDDIIDEVDIYQEALSLNIPGVVISSEQVLLPNVAQIKHRDAGGKIPWRNTSIKSLLMMPSSIEEGSSLLGLNLNRSELVKDNVVPLDQSIQGGRISQDVVAKMEQYLEKEYMPFYFHDLRTNEIITTHAFLESISETHSAEYVETEGYGRIGSIPVYKNTKREFSIAFKMVALDNDDMDMLYYKLNRLGTMLYPQWTKGRLIEYSDPRTGANNRIIQPFSQQIAASPLIRLRVGDLVKSNYSKFALARLFGVADGAGNDRTTSFNIDNAAGNTAAVANARLAADRSRTAREERERTINGILTRQNNGQLPMRQRFLVNEVLFLEPRTNPYPIVTALGEIPNPSEATLTGARNRQRRPGERFRQTGRRRIETREEVTVVDYAEPNGSPNVIVRRNNGELLCVPPSNLTPNRNLVERGIRDPVDVLPNDANEINNTNEGANAFFSDRNPVFKAFASTRGKGLAGYIKSFELGIEQNVPWHIDEFNKRAPTILNISIQFTPIYDITPGLDHNGFMTAPIWNVGSINQTIFGDRERETADAEAFKASIIQRGGSKRLF